MILIRFRVKNFRSISDSGWVDNDKVTALVGVNEAGKSNLLLALWKLNPATGGEINKLEDMPRSNYSEWRDQEEQQTFITCEFELQDTNLINEIMKLTSCNENDIAKVSISRTYSGQRSIGFPNFKQERFFKKSIVFNTLTESKDIIQITDEMGVTEKGLKGEILAAFSSAEEFLRDTELISIKQLETVKSYFDLSFKPLKKSKLQPLLTTLQESLLKLSKRTARVNPSSNSDVRKLIVKYMPKFVYYSNYGNLDSEIYLPHVIENMERDDLSPVMQAKTRTLKVLFEFVNLDPQEILDLGEETKLDNNNRARKLSEDEIDSFSQKKAERDILLQSAGLRLTEEFKIWWKQGNYKFRFQADGKHFKIWVSDDKRPEEISLEGRSTGLQWFLSFYLIFLVESKDTHENAILLLDEAGVSLHPLAQKDLVNFFDNLALKNQLIHTTHSPFLVDTSHIDRVKVIYMNEDGRTVASNDLRAAKTQSNKNTSVYAVHAALGLSVSDILLQGCKTIIVEGPSDQYYLNGIKNFLINRGKIQPKEEIIFVPSGGVKGIRALSSLLSGKDEELPIILIDSDSSGKGQKASLLKDLYKDNFERIIELEEIVGIDQAEVEDLIPFELLEKYITKLSRGTEEDFTDYYTGSQTLLPQIEKFFSTNEIPLEPGWKVDLARNVKATMLKSREAKKITSDTEKLWTQLFKRLL
ncbi:AAA family ATPase [Alkalihalobacillus sp. FSL R5-0424]